MNIARIKDCIKSTYDDADSYYSYAIKENKSQQANMEKSSAIDDFAARSLICPVTHAL